MSQETNTTRRTFLRAAGVSGAGIILASGSALAQEQEKEKEMEEKVTPGEDLMREHGVLKRILLVYHDYIHRIDGKAELPPAPLNRAAKLIRSFVEDYHEKLEENHLFPRFKKAGKLVELVETLQTQHKAGRRLTDHILHLSTAQALKDASDRRQLKIYLAQFIRMYEPHEAREDTVLFPALTEIISKNEYDSLGEEFEEQEHKLFGEEGFYKIVDQVASIEKALGLYDLAQYTPKG